ncbi:MAG: hypothetical protein E3J41_03770 [Candidatus Cloacimonadota bacterium]|nr:MAG: hypothetical protein E3J41_03770 [Candidatus Cloacimonadota bacterium]
MDVWKFLKSVFIRTNKNWKLIVVEFITSLIMIPIIILGIVIPVILIVIPVVQGNFEAEDFIPFFLNPDNLIFILPAFFFFLIFALASLILWAFVAGGIRASLLENILKEKRFDLNTFMAYSKKFFGRMVGLWILIGLIYFGIFVVLGGISYLILLFCLNLSETSEVCAILTGVFSGFIIFFVFMVVGFLMGIFLAIANTYLIVEDAEVVKSMKGSFRFIKNNPGHTFLVVLLLVVIGFGVTFIYSLITMPITMIPYIGALFSFALIPVQMGINLYIVLFSTTAYLMLYLWKRKKLTSDFQTSTTPEKTM